MMITSSSEEEEEGEVVEGKIVSEPEFIYTTDCDI
jgi:hypothetical protein